MEEVTAPLIMQHPFQLNNTRANNQPLNNTDVEN